MMDNKENFDWKNCLETIKSHGKEKNIVTILLNHCFDTILSRFDTINKFLTDEKFKNYQEIWNNSLIRMVVDGGANHFYNIQQSLINNNNNNNNSDNSKLFDPNFITGDFDSIEKNIMEHFKHKDNSIKIMHTPDQDYTDFTKALFILNEHVLAVTSKKIDCILVFFSNSGRIDQYLSILSTVHNFNINHKTFPPIILVDMVDSISFVLKKGIHRIPKIDNANWCSLIPLCGGVKLKTNGLRWNLDEKLSLEFGRFISSSNEFDKNFNEIIIDVDERSILFSTEFHL